MDLKKFKLHTPYSGISEQIKPFELTGQDSLKFESGQKFKPLLAIW